MLKLSEIFQDNMLFQRQKPIKIWGESTKKQKIKVYMNDILLAEEKIAAGTFELLLPAQEASIDNCFKILEEDGEEIVLTNVDIGEIWIAGGQSNMEFNLQYDREGVSMIDSADDPHFRFYDVGEFAFEGEREEGLKTDAIHWDKWVSFCKEDAPWFSAVGTYFGLQLRKELGIPVAIVGCNWGGTTASAWLDEGLLRADNELCIYTREYDKATAKLNFEKYCARDKFMREQTSSERGVADTAKMLKNENTVPPKRMQLVIGKLFQRFSVIGPHSENRPGGLYQMMLSKVAGFSARGVIWYQGESDDNHAEIYGRLFTAMINCWRNEWKEDLPFLFVQLAPFEAWMSANGKQYPMLRAQQQLVEDTVPNTYMASIMDIGSRYDIHPKEKRLVGERLARLALCRIYNHKMSDRAPRIQYIQKEDGKLVVEFAYAEQGLEAFGDISDLFTVKKAQKILHVSADVENNKVILFSPDIIISEQYEVSFAYVPYCKMTLYEKSGLAARPAKPVIV